MCPHINEDGVHNPAGVPFCKGGAAKRRFCDTAPRVKVVISQCCPGLHQSESLRAGSKLPVNTLLIIDTSNYVLADLCVIAFWDVVNQPDPRYWDLRYYVGTRSNAALRGMYNKPSRPCRTPVESAALGT